MEFIKSFEKFNWFKSKPKEIIKSKELDFNEFKKEAEDMLSYLLDDCNMSLIIDDFLKEFKVTLKVNQESYEGDLQEFHHQVNGFETKDFYAIKEDFISYYLYILRKYKVEQEIRIENADTLYIKYFKPSELENIKNIKFTSISFYVKKML